MRVVIPSTRGGKTSVPSRMRAVGERLARTWLVVIGLAVFLAGCIKVGPDYMQPPPPVQPDWLETSAQLQVAPTQDRAWWKVFKDPILDALVEEAYKQNLTVLSAGLRIFQARAELGISVGSLYPQSQGASGGYTYTRRTQNTANLPAGLPTNFESWDVGFDSAWELDFWGKFRRQVSSSTAGLEAAVANYDDVLVTLVSDVAATYVQLRTFEEQLKIARDNVEIQARSLRIADVRFKNGAVTELDVTQATSLLNDTKSTIPTFQIGIRQAQNALSILLGQPPQDLTKKLAGLQAIPKPPPEVAIGMPTELLRRRPDIRRAEREVASQSELIGVAKADLFPAFSISGTFGFTASDFANMYNGKSFNGFGGPSFRWNLLNFGRLANNVRVQDALFQQLAVDYQNTVLGAYQEVEDSIVAFLREQDRVQFLAKSVKASRRSVDLSLAQYREGAADYQRVLDSQTTLVSAQNSLAQSQGDVSLNLISTYKALGGGWQIRAGQDFVPQVVKDEMEKRTNWGDLLQAKEVEDPPQWKPDAPPPF